MEPCLDTVLASAGLVFHTNFNSSSQSVNQLCDQQQYLLAGQQPLKHSLQLKATSNINTAQFNTGDGLNAHGTSHFQIRDEQILLRFDTVQRGDVPREQVQAVVSLFSAHLKAVDAVCRHLLHPRLVVLGRAGGQNHGRGALMKQQALPPKIVPAKPEALSPFVPEDKGPGALDLLQAAQYCRVHLLVLTVEGEAFRQFFLHEIGIRDAAAVQLLASKVEDIAVPLEHIVVALDWLLGHLITLAKFIP